MVEIRPQPRQETFLSSSADIAIYGGSAGGGKTWSMLLEPLRHLRNPEFGAVVFRRTIPEITKEGGMWDEARKVYPLLGGKSNENDHSYVFPSGARISFAHLQYEKTLSDWLGAQIPLIEFDQLETFTEKQFFYMLSRNRSTCGVRPYVRATCNPEPNWLAEFLGWWLDDDGYAIPERSGAVRWMVRVDDRLHWADEPGDLVGRFPGSKPKSVTFILSTVYDNKILLDANPEYLANLQALSYVDRERLLGDARRGGNWKVKPAAGKLFNRSWFEIVDAVPEWGGRTVRNWDLAATEAEWDDDDPDSTASCKMKRVGNIYYILDATNDKLSPAQTDAHMLGLAGQDGKQVAVRWEQEGGASGKRDSRYIATLLSGYDAVGVRPQGDKITRAKGLAAQALARNVKLLRGPWNEWWLNSMHAQPAAHDDDMDAASGAFNDLAAGDSTGIATSYLGQKPKPKRR